MKIREDLQGILNKAFSDVGTFSKPDSAQAMSDALSVVTKEEKSTETPIIKRKFKKSEITNALSKKDKPTMKLPIGKLFSIGKMNEEKKQFSITKKELLESWSQKYKDSIDCDNPKGFSQKAHCQGKVKKGEQKETSAISAGGFSAPLGFDPQSKFVKDSFEETPKKTETKEATGASSAGSYVTTSAWAKSLSPKDWRGKSKTQIPGGGFVQVKKKCKTFPYCNQGDINALKITKPKKNKKKVVKELSDRHNLSETIIRKILQAEFGTKK